MDKNCKFCGEEFLSSREHAKYCSDDCRHAWNYRNASEKTLKRRKESHKKWAIENWQRRRNYNLNITYGISPEQYEELLLKQHSCCGVCGRHETEFSRKLAVDHDHSTGEIYGLLCSRCNHSLIGKHRDPNIFLKAAEYLRQGTGWIVPTKKRKKRRKRKQNGILRRSRSNKNNRGTQDLR